ncbi:uncharacterized protein PAC_01818 [Phialocephala subalpina]|uniref:Uncharacterized protein n=1 Tax=Phialocephala subalpina TaxID=576137 RepID=A0A1L7WGN1_9HELO|nr:uncharacterized protein PAC_01818 [Phialocephala subalpina]
MTSTPPLNLESYAWKQLSDKPSVWQRPALAGESMWIPRSKDLHELFICSTLTFKPPVLRRTFNESTKSAWTTLRFHVPELGLSTKSGRDGKSFMQYHAPSVQAANAWISRTSSFQSGSSKQDFDVLRKTVLDAKQDHDADNAFLLSRAILEDENKGGNRAELVKHAQIMIYVDHQVADGIGARILLGKYLTLLSSDLGRDADDVERDIRWEDSWKNLSPPWITLMNSDQIISGLEYEDNAAENQNVILNKLKHNPGLPLLPSPHHNLPPTQETHFTILSTHQTTALLSAIKHVISPTSNITHLGHAAMVLAILRSIQLPTTTRALYSPCWLNGRRYLRDSELAKSYVPICQSFAPVVFDGMEELVLSPEATKGELGAKLIRACRVATGEYGMIKARKSMLPECVVLFEELGQKMALSAEQNKKSASEGETKKSEEPQTADPFFLSDGVTEQYISHSYPISSPEPLITVDDVQFAASSEKNLIVRMSSWRGQTTISGEWKGCDFDKVVIVRFLEEMFKIMFSIVDDKDI